MALDASLPRTRRAILAASLGGLAATVGAALHRPTPVSAHDPDDVLLGASNSTDGETAISSTGIWGLAAVGDVYGLIGHGGEYGVKGESQTGIGVYGVGHEGTGIYGSSESSTGVVGTSPSIGVSGTSTTGTGVAGSSGSGAGVHAYSNATNQPAGRGWSAGNSTGLLGYSGDSLPAAPAQTGVYGSASQDANSRGVHGMSTTGRGVYGEATTGFGVRGYATSGSAVYGLASTGYALRSSGRIRFDKSGGIATIAQGTNNILVTPGIDLTTATAVIATLLGSAGGTTTVHRVAVDTAANTFRIYLTANATVAVKVSWLAFG